MPLKVSSRWEKYTPPEDLIEEALGWLRAQGRSRTQAKANILGIIEQYKKDEVAQRSSLSIGGAISAANELADQTKLLAKRYRQAKSPLEVGTATKPLGEYETANPATEEFKNRVAERADQLDGWASEFLDCAERWSEQPRQIKVHENINLGPQRRLLNDSALLFRKHRPEDFHAGPRGQLYAFVRVVYELATGKTPSKTALLTPLRDIVDAIRKQ